MKAVLAAEGWGGKSIVHIGLECDVLLAHVDVKSGVHLHLAI